MGGLDLSVLVLFILLQFLNYVIGDMLSLTSETCGSCFNNMSTQRPAWREKEDLILRLYIQPKASRDQWMGQHGEEIKLAITAPPVDGKANAHLTKFLSKQFKVAKGQIEIEKGELGRHKQVRIQRPVLTPEILIPLIPDS